ncbi:MAG: hypothetical protein HQL13_08225, partial [Candidatus Omnitrophica bacterium]|nr:hypothetical protein [Candidatus Omnitrophota bacterium]
MYKPVSNKILVDVLIKSDLISANEADSYVQKAKEEHKNLDTYLIRHGILHDHEIV